MKMLIWFFRGWYAVADRFQSARVTAWRIGHPYQKYWDSKGEPVVSEEVDCETAPRL